VKELGVEVGVDAKDVVGEIWKVVSIFRTM